MKLKRSIAAAGAAAALVVTAAVSAEALSSRLTSLSSSNRNLSYIDSAGALRALAPGGSVSGAKQTYAACSGVTVISINGGPPFTQTPCTWRNLGTSSLVVKTVHG